MCNEESGDIKTLIDIVPEMQEVIQAMVILSCISVKLVNPVFAQTDAIGSGMRKKIKSITDPISLQLKVILGKS